jgi:RhoGEF, Guanine nucleotide exchange factor for Rho/Rac/Cdc42-like GTPases
MECFAEKGFSENWFNYKTIGDTIVCSKTCYNKHVLTLRRKPVWSNDGEKGHDDPNTSEKILLDWLMVEGNYSNKWRGKDSKGRTKKQVAAELASMMNAVKVWVTRDGKQVMNKNHTYRKIFLLCA